MECAIEAEIGRSLISSDARECLTNAVTHYNESTDFDVETMSKGGYEYGESLIAVLEYALTDTEAVVPNVYSHSKKIEMFRLDELEVPDADTWVNTLKKTGGQVVIQWYEAAKQRIDGYTVWNPGDSLCNVLIGADGDITVEQSDSGDVRFQLSSDTKVPIVRHRDEIYSVIKKNEGDDEISILQYDNTSTSLFVDVKEDEVHDFSSDGFRSVTEPVREIISTVFAPQREIASRFIGYYHDESEVFTPNFEYWKTLLEVSAGQVAVGLYYTDTKDELLSHVIFRNDMIEITVDNHGNTDTDSSWMYTTVTINDVQETPENEVENIVTEGKFNACAVHIRQIEELNSDITIPQYKN